MLSDTEIPFQDYLEAKIGVDSESLHASSFRLFRHSLAQRDRATIVDLGTGTGAMIRRIVATIPPGRFRFVGVDADDDCLATARIRTAQELSGLEYTVTARQDRLVAQRRSGGETREVEVQYIHGSIFDPVIQARLQEEQPWAITAHALMDCLPLNSAIDIVHRMLPAGGLFYATLNYDGRTDLMPEYENVQFESMVLDVYNLSMEERRVMGRPIGGSRSGVRLYGELLAAGFTPLSTGASDWSLAATETNYEPSVLTVLRALLGMIYREMVVQHDGLRPEIDLQELDRWCLDRLECARVGTLAAIVHQTDVLARRA